MSEDEKTIAMIITPETRRQLMTIIKSIASCRIPNYDLPADSHLEKIALKIFNIGIEYERKQTLELLQSIRNNIGFGGRENMIALLDKIKKYEESLND